MKHMGDGFTGSIREEDALGKAYDARLMRRILHYIYPYKLCVAGTLACMVLSQVVNLATPLLVMKAIDGPLARAFSGDGTGRLGELSGIVGLYAVLTVVQFGFSYYQTVLMRLISQKVMHRIRVDVFGHLQSLSLSFFDANPVGRLVTRVTNDVEALNELFTSGIIALVSDFFMFFGMLGVMLVISVKMTLVALSIIPPLFVGAYLFRRKARETFRNIRMKIARVYAFIGETVSGIRVIQIFTQEGRCAAKFEEVNGEYLGENLKAVKYMSFFHPYVELLAGLGKAGIIWAAAVLILGTPPALTFGAFYLFWRYLGMFFMPIIDLSDKYSILQSAMASSERIFKLLDTKPDICCPDAPAALPAACGKVEFRNVWLTYDSRDKDAAGANYVLKDVSFSVEPGESVALVGATGAGKTSIISALSRLYDIRRGAVLVGGVDVRLLDPRTLRRRVGTVMQDVFLFSGDVRQNITLGEASFTDEHILEACRLVNADRFLERLPEGLDSPVAERGVTFSAGERQLLAFARAVVRQPAIIVLDEATSSVDTQTEQIIQEGLFRLMRGRTCIVIAHRLSTIKRTNRIIVLHHGEIREVGTHQELLDRGGIYRKLYELHYRSQEVRAPTGAPARLDPAESAK